MSKGARTLYTAPRPHRRPAQAEVDSAAELSDPPNLAFRQMHMHPDLVRKMIRLTAIIIAPVSLTTRTFPTTLSLSP